MAQKKKTGKKEQVPGHLPIYNCHTHTFTYRNMPEHILNLKLGPILGPLASMLFGPKGLVMLLGWWMKLASERDKELLRRLTAFVRTGTLDTQAEVLKGIQRQYPADTIFVVLPMDTKYMRLGRVPESLEKQHQDLLEIARNSNGLVIPFYAADPRREDLVEQVRKNLVPGRFQGIKIYPNLGYTPTDPKLMEVYAICQERGAPVMTHCNTGGLYQAGLTAQDCAILAHPKNYQPILREFPRLRLCLAHFGGNSEWDRQLTSTVELDDNNQTWISYIADMIRSGEYPNLYTDISYTIFTLQPHNLHVTYFDYLKVLLANPLIRDHVLFGSDYYMVEQEPITEKQISIALRSRIGEELYFQIAHYNPKQYLGVP